MQRNRTSERPHARNLVLLLALAFSSSAPAAVPPDDSAYAAPQQRVEIVGGRKMNLYCLGNGAPTVVFDSGLSDWSFTWALVHPRVAKLTRACVYDRAGLGYSDPANRAATSNNMVDDLHRLLKAAQITPPYVLVGHSLGGLNVRLYADRFLGEVAGMVLVDPSHEDGIARIDAQRHGQETRRYAAEIKRWRACARTSSKQNLTAPWRLQCIEPDDRRYSAELNAERVKIAQRRSYQIAQLSEAVNYLNGRSFAFVRAARRDYGALPLVVLSAAQTTNDAGPDWLQMHRELASLSSLGVQRTVTAGHYVQLDQPDSVIEAIASVLQQASLLTTFNQSNQPRLVTPLH